MKKGFTILELVVVMIIIAILVSLAFSGYNKAVEKGRASEAKAVLGQIRRAEIAYYQDYGNYTNQSANLMISNIPLNCAQNTSYFRFQLFPNQAAAFRCTLGGKPPTGSAYNITINYNTGALSNSSGY